MDIEEVMGLLALLALVVFPALALTVRLSLKPIVEAIVRLREAFVGSDLPASQARIARLEGEVRELKAEVERLAEVEEFYARLREPGTAPSLPPRDPSA